MVQGHRFYRLCGTSRGDRARVEVRAGERRVFAVTGRNLDIAFLEAAERLDQHIGHRKRGRRGGVPTSVEIEDLLDALPPTTRTKFLHLLRTHAGLNGGRATGSQIAKAAGKDISYFWWVYDRIGRKFASALGAEIPRPLRSDVFERKAVLTFAKLERTSVNEEWTLTLRHPVKQALARIARRVARPHHASPITSLSSPRFQTQEVSL